MNDAAAAAGSLGRPAGGRAVGAACGAGKPLWPRLRQACDYWAQRTPNRQ